MRGGGECQRCEVRGVVEVECWEGVPFLPGWVWVEFIFKFWFKVGHFYFKNFSIQAKRVGI